MNLILAGIGAIVAVIGLVLIYFWRKTGQELDLMKSTPASRAADIAAMPPGTVVEVKGPVRCAAPLVGEFSQQKCVYYHSVVQREYERQVRDSKGDSRTERERETISSNERFAPCVVEDASGKVTLDFTGAKVEGVEVVKRFEPAAANLVGSIVGSLVGGSRDIGMHYSETLIAPDAQVFVLGTVQAGGAIGQSHGKKTPFVISIKSQEQREKDLGSTRIWQVVGAVVCFAIALGFLYAAVKTG